MTFSFSKYHGTGNDFILIDNREMGISVGPGMVAKICHRQYGIGGDGVIFLRPSNQGDYAMQIFNADGSEAEMCGNGLRCLVQFIQDLGDKKAKFQIETMKKVYTCKVSQGEISVQMGVPKIVEEKDSEYLLEVGVPHLVVFTDNLARFDLEARDRFSDLGVNINYAMLDPLNTLHVRTFERGVEEETFSCGSGATAVCMAAWHRFGISGSIEVIFGSTEKLQFEMLTENKKLVEINMSGDVCHVYNGMI
ncbi:diaminopimelate epimerase [Candidatus Neptunichlamydia sp. REUL1]|uniref:diaminopimelate epimerase n=1 Tax=Candidatus Neptunichlamydia sp. REUL1 TaxID=3064277 RepID=UPI00292DEBA8|nr:diaminopimelate epimerase [Candidatus Neptunochlamydia sp. REUL1]